MVIPQSLQCPFFQRAFGWCIPIGGLGGLIGLGGGEFRLPVLMYALGFDAKSAIPLNLVVSLVTLAFSMLVRSRAVSADAILPYLPDVIGLATGGLLSAYYGAQLVQGLADKRLVQTVGVLLAGVGVLMLVETAHPFNYAAVLPASPTIHVAAGLALGIGIGFVSSMLGVAGGELLIPTLMFIFGADIRTAGSASILISLGVVLMGIWRYWRLAAIPTGGGIKRITSAMAAGSIIGAAAGGLAVGYAPVDVLKVTLGCVLIAAAAKTIARAPHGQEPR
jgi:uncharacterized membrane protein YfcA